MLARLKGAFQRALSEGDLLRVIEHRITTPPMPQEWLDKVATIRAKADGGSLLDLWRERFRDVGKRDVALRPVANGAILVVVRSEAYDYPSPKSYGRKTPGGRSEGTASKCSIVCCSACSVDSAFSHADTPPASTGQNWRIPTPTPRCASLLAVLLYSASAAAAHRWSAGDTPSVQTVMANISWHD